MEAKLVSHVNHGGVKHYFYLDLPSNKTSQHFRYPVDAVQQMNEGKLEFAYRRCSGCEYDHTDTHILSTITPLFTYKPPKQS